MENFNKPFENTETDPGKLSIAFYSGIFSYAGWYVSMLTFICRVENCTLEVCTCRVAQLSTIMSSSAIFNSAGTWHIF